MHPFMPYHAKQKSGHLVAPPSESSDGVKVLRRASPLGVSGQPADESLEDFAEVQGVLPLEDEGERQDALLDALPETKRWDPVPGSEGQQTVDSPMEDEDAEGRSPTEQSFDEGVAHADRERVEAADQAALKEI